MMLGRVFQYPGVFPVGSAADEAMKARWQNKKSDFGFKIKGDIADFGIIPDMWDQADRTAMPTKNFSNDILTRHYDSETLALLDFRIRWCRCYLDDVGFPYDREDIYVNWKDPDGSPSWAYVSDVLSDDDDLERTDPLDFLGLLNFAISGPSYAGKILLHFRRADRFLDKETLTPSDAIGLSREMMLIGETWCEAKFVINHARAAISGEKVAGGRRNSAHATNIRHVPLREERFDRMAALVPALGVENAARQCEAEGLGGWQGIKKQWDRHKNRDT